MAYSLKTIHSTVIVRQQKVLVLEILVAKIALSGGIQSILWVMGARTCH